MVLDDDTADEDRATVAAAPSNMIATAVSAIDATVASHTPAEANTATSPEETVNSPDPASDLAAATRRGLRARRPAQQRPYSYDADVLYGSETEMIEEEPITQPPSSIPSRRVSIASLHNEPLGQLDLETLAILQGGVEPEPEHERRGSHGRPKHFKGKGRAWKKEESDEDLEFNPGKKKSAKAKKAKAQQQPKKRGRPRKTILSDDIIRDESDGETLANAEAANASAMVPEGSAKKTRKPTRKSVLSEELVRDDTEEDEKMSASNSAIGDAATPEASTSASKRRPRISDQSVSSRGYEESEENMSYTPKRTPNKSCTPKGTPNQSNTPKSELKQVTVPTLEVAPTDKRSDDGLESEKQDDSIVVTPSDIEAHMASVNADDDDDQELCKLSRNDL
jgi:hypothetical protein